MIVRFWGVRGSIPVPGPDTLRFGGNTACVSIEADGTVVVLDAGTGIKNLGAELAGGDDRIVLLLSHPHWDHINALPFFTPLYIQGNEFEICGPAQPGASMRDLVAEEGAELGQAIAAGDWDNLREEVGDVLFNLLLVTQIAGEQGLFDWDDVCTAEAEKMIRRHPHVYGDAHAATAAEAIAEFNEAKAAERRDDATQADK